MSTDAKNSLEVFGTVIAWLLPGWIALGLVNIFTAPNWAVAVAGGVYGAINLFVIVRGLWVRRAANPENPNND